MCYYIYPVLTESCIIAPAHSKTLKKLLVRLYGLDKKYEKGEHLDRIFFRRIWEKNGKMERLVWISGKTFKSAIHTRARNDLGEEWAGEKTRVEGLFFREKYAEIELVTVTPLPQKNQKNVTPKSKVMVTEIIPALCGGILVFPEEPPKMYFKIPRVQIGGRRSQGCGWLRIFWDNLIKTDDLIEALDKADEIAEKIRQSLEIRRVEEKKVTS